MSALWRPAQLRLQPPSKQAYGRTAWVKDAWDNTWYLTVPPEKTTGQ